MVEQTEEDRGYFSLQGLMKTCLIFCLGNIFLMGARELLIYEQYKSLKEQIETLQLEFEAMAAVRFTEITYFENRIRKMELFLMSKGYEAPASQRVDLIAEAEMVGAQQKLRGVISEAARNNSTDE